MTQLFTKDAEIIKLEHKNLPRLKLGIVGVPKVISISKEHYIMKIK